MILQTIPFAVIIGSHRVQSHYQLVIVILVTRFAIEWMEHAVGKREIIKQGYKHPMTASQYAISNRIV